MDDKKYYRDLKKTLKKAGNRKLRRFLKDPDNTVDDFDYEGDKSSALNGRDRHKKKDKAQKWKTNAEKDSTQEKTAGGTPDPAQESNGTDLGIPM